MTSSSTSFAETTIVAFHIGRGGHFHNPGFLRFIAEEKISKYTDKLFLNYENLFDLCNRLDNDIEDWDSGDTNYHSKVVMTKKDVFMSLCDDMNFEEIEKRFGVKEEEFGELVYFDGNGNPVGLTEAEANAGVGCINEDNDYDTTYTCYLNDCDESELQAILDYNGYVDSAIVAYAKEQLGIVDEEETKDEE